MSQHSVKIEDKLYVKLKAYCDLNKESVFKICNEAIEEYLNKIQFGDAPFMRHEHENRQFSQETPVKIDKIAEKDETLLEKLANSGMVALDSVKSDKDGNVEIHMKKLDGIDSIETKFTVHNDGTVEIDKQETQQRPKKRRL